jgi:hypothetical protein
MFGWQVPPFVHSVDKPGGFAERSVGITVLSVSYIVYTSFYYHILLNFFIFYPKQRYQNNERALLPGLRQSVALVYKQGWQMQVPESPAWMLQLSNCKTGAWLSGIFVLSLHTVVL